MSASADPGRPLDKLLPRLQRVRQIRDGYVASCPGPGHTHGDRHPSLRINEKPDGALLLWCPVCQNNAAILRAVELDLADLFPPREPALQRERDNRPRDRLDAWTALRLIATEVDRAALLIAVCAKHELSQERRQRLMQAAHSIRLTMKACGLRDFT